MVSFVTSQSWEFERSLLVSYFNRSHLIKNPLNNTCFSCISSLIECTPFIFQGLLTTVPAETLKNSCYCDTVWEEIGHLSACQEIEACGWFKMEVYDANESNYHGIFHHNTWDQTNLEQRDLLTWELESHKFFWDHDESFAYTRVSLVHLLFLRVCWMYQASETSHSLSNVFPFT